jgi:hypothetical protein
VTLAHELLIERSMLKRAHGLVALIATGCGGPAYDIDTAVEQPLTTTMTTTYSGTTLLSNQLTNPTKPLGIYQTIDPYAGIGPNGTSLGTANTTCASTAPRSAPAATPPCTSTT